MTEEVNAMTPEGLEALRKEVEELETVGRQEIAERIRIAREWGDLKENAEYHDAKNSQALLERKITLLNAQLRNAVAVEVSNEDTDVVGFGSSVRLVDKDSGKEMSYTLVGSAEANLAEGKLSIDSPVGKALQGHRVGDVAVMKTPSGERHLEVLEVGV